MTLDRSDFRLRKVPTGYKVSQRIGSGWELLSEIHATKADAEVYIKGVITDEPPLPEIACHPAFLYAHGNESQLIVVRSIRLRVEADPRGYDDDNPNFLLHPCGRRVERWLHPVFDHIERFGLVLMDRQTHRDTSMMGYRAERSWYVAPQFRIGLLANRLDALP